MLIIDQWKDLLLTENFFELQNFWQLVLTSLLLLATSKILKIKSDEEIVKDSNPALWFKRNRSFLVFWILIVSAFGTCTFFKVETPIFRFFSILGGVWILIGLVTSCIPRLFWARSAAAVAYFLTGALGMFSIENSIQTLRSLSLSIGSTNISAWSILSGIFAFAFSLWAVMAIAGVIETQIQRIPRISSSLKVLTVKMMRIAFIIIAVIVAMSSVGIDLSAITVLSGAVGLGVGFGLQKVVSNFISGILLLVDNSIKPGDVIEIDGTYGWINNLRARYASVITRDGTEHLIPNEDLITQRVINWTFTDNKIRINVPFGVSYNADPHECIKLAIEAAKLVGRVLDYPAPICNLKGFGDSSVDFELRFWISDPTNGVSNVKSQVLLNIWDTLKEHNIEIPFPQRDLHIRSSSVALPTMTTTDRSEG
jgi:small-conductance mechanosensitive channel